jgi:hypothetical protein
MVDSVKGAAISSLIRAQTANVQTTRPLTQGVTIDQPQKSAVIRVKASAVPQSGKTGGGPSTNLPRGSLVDKLV